MLIASPNLVEGICNNLEQDRTEEIQFYNNELKFMNEELRRKLEEEADLLKRARQAIKENNKDKEKNYNLMLFQTVGEREELEKRIEEYNVYIKNNSTSKDIDNELSMTALKDFDKLYQIEDNATRKVLLRSLIKKIEMNKDRES